MFEGIIVGCHAVARRDGPQGEHIIVRAPVAHHSDGSHRQKNGKRLPNLVVETGFANLVEIDSIRFAQDFESVARDLARYADGKARARKRMPPHESFGQAQFTTQCTYLVLEELT